MTQRRGPVTDSEQGAPRARPARSRPHRPRPPRVTATARRFLLVRREDVSGVSGTGVVAHGVVFPDGTCALRWDSGDLASTAVYDNLDTLEAIHGHGGATRVQFLDGQAAA